MNEIRYTAPMNFSAGKTTMRTGNVKQCYKYNADAVFLGKGNSPIESALHMKPGRQNGSQSWGQFAQYSVSIEAPGLPLGSC